MAGIDDVINTLSADELDTLNSDPQLLADFKKKYSTPAAPEAAAAPAPKQGILGQAWSDLKVPEEKSREGLKMITDAGVKAQNWLANKTGLPIGTEPTGNMARDIAANVPRIAGETLTKVAPSFVSRGSIVAGGLLNGAQRALPALAPAAKWLSTAAEDSSGLSNVPVKTPGLLEEAFKNPDLIKAPGTDEASKLYDYVQNGAQQIRPALKYTQKPMEFVKRAMSYANNGSLTTDEALAARQELDGIKDQVTGAFYRNARGVLDFIAKQDYSGADEAYKTGIKADALRSFTAINKNGTPSVARSIMTFLNPKAALMYSPVVQGQIASKLGSAYQAVQGASAVPNVMAASGIVDNIENLVKRKSRPDPEFSRINGKIQEGR